ncbi:hypothetical protein [Modestobacter marinus]|uniref:hypothetical protein n=1 Tax=Modestobacter marinus TaxID=477641 RepID=UPI001C945B86|nr:hypothetical protein [Modestobacter marinus]
MTDLTTERATGRDEPGPGPDLPVLLEPTGRAEWPPAGPPSVAAAGVELTRLIGLARLTPQQALEIAASLLADVADRAEPDTGAPGSDPVTIDRVVVGADGQVGLVPAAGGGHGGTRLALAPLLADVAGAARLRGRRPDPAADRLLDELDRARTALPVAGVPVAARMLRDAAAGIDREAVRAELAALVRAVDTVAARASGSGPAGSPRPVVRAAPAGPRGGGAARSAGRRAGAWLLSVLVLATVVVLEVALLRDDITTDIDLLLDAGRGGTTPSAAPEPDGLPVPAPAPAAAGSVAAVDLRPLAACAPGAPCTVRLLVRLVPGADPQVVTWSYRIVDRCTGVTETVPGGTVTVPPQGERAVAVGTVPLPALAGVAVLAVTDLPAAAASAPVLIGSCLSDRQAG